MSELQWPGGDNLYKAITYGGVALFVVCLVFPLRRAEEIRLQTIELEGKLEKSRIHISRLGEDVDELRSQTEFFREEIVSDSVSPPDSVLAVAFDLLDRLQSLEEPILHRDTVAVTLATDARKLKFLSNRLDLYLTVGGLGAGLGLIIAASGAVYWYLRVQHPRDQAIAQLADGRE